jgi:NAD(P)-dependent dehydrogenase (short-subunit alcohol dehydrogenase family)
MKRICVIDGQGGGMGSAIIRKLRESLEERVEVIALGTNAIATAQMLKARANRGASGENAIVHTVASAHVILGPLGIVLANAMMGEVTPRMAAAVADSPALKLLLPLSQENVRVVGVVANPLPHLVEALVEEHLRPYLEMEATTHV